MRVDEYRKRPPKNKIGGGPKKKDEYNHSPSRSEWRRKEPDQFASSKVEETPRFSESKDVTSKAQKSSNRSSESKNSKKNKSSTKSSNLMRNVVGLAAGSVVVVTQYQDNVEAREAELAAKAAEEAIVTEYAVETTDTPVVEETAPVEESVTEPEQATETSQDASEGAGENGDQAGEAEGAADQPDSPKETPKKKDTKKPEDKSTVETSAASASSAEVPVTEPVQEKKEEQTQEEKKDPVTVTGAEWIWNGNTSATLKVSYSDGSTKEIAGAPTVSEVPATCTEAGLMTYSVTAAVEGKNYSDAKKEVLPALGHSFTSSTEVVQSDGSVVAEYICDRCGEHYTFDFSVEEY